MISIHIHACRNSTQGFSQRSGVTSSKLIFRIRNPSKKSEDSFLTNRFNSIHYLSSECIEYISDFLLITG